MMFDKLNQPKVATTHFSLLNNQPAIQYPFNLQLSFVVHQLEQNGKLPEDNPYLIRQRLSGLGLHQTVDILIINGRPTVYLKDDFNALEFDQLKRTLDRLGIKPQQVIGSPNNLMSYQECINRDVQMFQKNHPNLNTFMLLQGFTWSLWKKSFQLSQKKRALMKRIKQQKSSDAPKDEYDLFKQLKLKENEKKYFFMPDDQKIQVFTQYVKENISKMGLMLPINKEKDLLLSNSPEEALLWHLVNHNIMDVEKSSENKLNGLNLVKTTSL